MADMKEPMLEQMRAAHGCLSGMLEGLRMALKVGGPNARAQVSDLVAMIEAFQIGDTSPLSSRHRIFPAMRAMTFAPRRRPMDDRKPLCDHPNFEANVTVVRLEDVGRFTTDIHVRCAVCGVRFRWLGLKGGSHPTEPRVSVDAFELRAPIEPDAHLTSLMAGSDTGFPSTQEKP